MRKAADATRFGSAASPAGSDAWLSPTPTVSAAAAGVGDSYGGPLGQPGGLSSAARGLLPQLWANKLLMTVATVFGFLKTRYRLFLPPFHDFNTMN